MPPIAFLGLLSFAAFFTLLFASSEYRQTIVWGAVLGVLLGTWLIAPGLIRANHLKGLSFLQWLRLDAVVAAAFLVIGAIVASVLTWPAWAWHRLRRDKPLVSAPLAAWLAAFAALPVGYFALACAVEWRNFKRLPPLGPNAAFYFAAPLALGVMGTAAVISARRNAREPGARALAVITAVLLAIGGALMPFRTQPAEGASAAASIAPFRARGGVGHRPPLLVIGLDGGNWETMRPLIARLPHSTFARIAATGVTGTIEAQWPPYWSTPAWGAILTGYPADEVRVHEDLAATAPGLPPFELPLTLDPLFDPMFVVEYALIKSNVIVPTPVPRDRLGRPPIWERLSKSGVKTAVVRFPFTYPADRQADYVVSNRVITDLWGQLGVKPGNPADLVGPPGEAAWLNASLASPEGIDSSLSNRLLPADQRAMPADAIENPADVLDQVLAISQQMFSTTERIIRHDPELRVAMLHVTDFDNICHAYWQYRFPDAFGAARPAEADVVRLGPVVDKYLEYVDGRVGQLIAAFPEPPDVIIVADHGEEASLTSTLWKGWHARYGVFLAAGPDIVHVDHEIPVTYYDIAPTMLDLLGLEAAPDLRGKSIVPRSE